MIEEDDLILVPSGDHSYRKAGRYYTQVVYNKVYDDYSDYGGMEHVSKDEEVVMAWVVE